MLPAQNAPLDDSKTPPLFFWVVGISALVALVPTLWTDLDLRAATLFSGSTPTIGSVHWWWVELINLYVPAIFRGGIAVALVVWLIATARKQRKSLRLAMAFLVLAGILGPGIVVNWGFKDNWQRARPYQVENFGGTQQFTRAAVMTNQCDNNCSFDSGHVACGAFFASLMLIHRRRKVAWTVAGSASVLVIGFARMSDMAHWFSDVLWAFPITLVTCWLTWKALQWAYSEESKPSRTVE